MTTELEADRILKNLAILGEIKQNDKLMTIDDTFAIYPPTSVRGAYRWWVGERRDANLQRINDVLTTAFAYVSAANDDELQQNTSAAAAHAKVRRQRVLEALEASCKGLENLVQTYVDDTSCKVRIRLLIQRVRDFISIARSAEASGDRRLTH